MKKRSTLVSTVVKDPPAGAYKPEQGAEDRPKLTRCCAKCRRGVPGYGDLPCGYDLKCPNRCHEPKDQS